MLSPECINRRSRVGCTLEVFDSKNVLIVHRVIDVYVIIYKVYSLLMEEYCCYLHTYTVLLLYACLF